MKKKLFLGVAFAAILATGTAFASPVHPDKLGIGILWGGVTDGWGGSFNNNVALSLKLPVLPIFWGVDLGFGSNRFALGVQGDHYFLGSQLLPTLSWFMGLGAYVSFASYNHSNNDYDWSRLSFGGRIPIGLTWQPIDFFEVFLNLAPRLGVDIYTNSSTKDNRDGVRFGGGIGVELGLRAWL